MKISEIQRTKYDDRPRTFDDRYKEAPKGLKMVPNSDRYGYIIHSDIDKKAPMRATMSGMTTQIDFFDTKTPEKDIAFIGWIGLRPYNLFDGMTNGVQTSNIILDSRYRGQGIGLLMYLTVLNLGYILVADDTQTAQARKVWTVLNKTPGVEVRGLTFFMRSEIDPSLAKEWDKHEMQKKLSKLKKLNAHPWIPIDSVGQYDSVPFVFPVSTMDVKSGPELGAKGASIYSREHPEDSYGDLYYLVAQKA